MVNEGIVFGHKFLKEVLGWTKLRLIQLRKCHVLKISKVFVVSYVMLVSIGDLSKAFLKFLGLLLVFCKRIPFVFYDDCLEAFETLKKALITAPVVQPPDWNLPFEIMHDASDYVVGVVLGQRVDKKLNVIQYASKTQTVPREIMLLLKKNF